MSKKREEPNVAIKIWRVIQKIKSIVCYGVIYLRAELNNSLFLWKESQISLEPTFTDPCGTPYL